MAKQSSAPSYQAAAQTRERGLLGNVTDSLISGNGSIAGSIGRGISNTFKAKVTGLKEKFDPLNIARKLTGNTGAAILGRATGRSREDMEHFTGRSPRNKNAPAHQYTKTGPDLSELSKALYTKVSEGQRPKLKSGDSVSNVLAKIYNLFLINSKADSNVRDEDKRKKIEENELKEKQHKEILKALTGTGMAVPVKAKKEEGKSFLEIIGEMVKSVIGTVTGMIDSAIKQVTDMFGWITDFKWLKDLGWLKELTGLKTLINVLRFLAPLLTPLLIVGGIALTAWAGKQILDKMAQWHTGDPNATIEEVVSDKVKNIFGIKTEKEKRADKANAEHFKDVTDAATKNNNTIDEDVKNELLSQDWVQSNPNMVAALNQFRVNPKQNKSAMEIAGSQLPAPGQSTYDIGVAKSNASTGETSIKIGKMGGRSGATQMPSKPSPVDTATPIPPEPNPIGARIVDATTNNNDAKLSEDTTPKVINIDKSKTVGGGSSAPAIGMDSSVSVRIDDPTLQKLQKQGLRPI